MSAGPDEGPAAWTAVRARRIHTLDGPPAEAMVLLGDTVVATGGWRDLADRFPVDEVVELDGVLLPGLNDAHVHPTMTAENQLHVAAHQRSPPTSPRWWRSCGRRPSASGRGSG